MHRVMRDSPYQAAALLPDTESLPPSGIGGRLSKGHIDYDPFAPRWTVCPRPCKRAASVS